MSFVSSIIVVEDVIRSRYLYEKLLDLKVTADFGIYNVGFEGGLSLYQKALFQEITGGLNVIIKSNNFVLYFEVDRLDELEDEMAGNGFEFIHKIREQPWKQRTFRFYDYDGHILEIAERMDVVLDRLHREGKSVDEIAKLTGLPVDQVLQQIKNEGAR